MTYPHILWSVVAQVVFGLVIYGILYFSEIEFTNWFYIGNVGGFIESLIVGTLWSVAFFKVFPGQFWIFLTLPILAALCLLKSRDVEKRIPMSFLFHVLSTGWILFPIFTASFGTYRGP